MIRVKNKIKIIFVGIYNPEEILSGPEKVAKRIFTELKDKTDSVFIEYFFDGSKYSIWKKLFGLENIEFSEGNKILRMGLVRIIFFLIKFRPQLIHILTFERFSIVCFLVNWIIRAKILYTVHTVFFYENIRSLVKIHKGLKLKNRITEYILFKLSYKLIFVSEYCFELAKGYYKLNSNKIEIINNGIDEVFYNPDRIMNITKPLKIVFFNGVRSGIERKIDLIIEVLNRFKKFEIELYIIDENDFSVESDINFNISVIEPMTTVELAGFFKDMHILLKSPIYDSFSIICLEAMASGLICIISELVGMKFLIKNEQNGIIYDYINPKALEQNLKKILNNELDVETISKNAKQIFLKYSWKEIANKYFLLYKEILFDKN
jgi:glycosyltransferase involved in cell wall biosynthesis